MSAEQLPIWRHMAESSTPAAASGAARIPVLLVGAGPVGLTLALDLAQRGHRVVIVNRSTFIAGGSRAICFSQRTLEVWDRLGVAAPIVARGVTWSVGKVFWGDRSQPIYEFDLRRSSDRKMPAFVNLPQYQVEEVLCEALAKLPNVEIRWGHELTDLEMRADEVVATVSANGDSYRIAAERLVACDGARSQVRQSLGLEFVGETFEDNFLIADIRMAAERPAERWFWFDPPFNRGKSALMHRQPDGVWRLDFQLGRGIDREQALRPDHVKSLVRGLIGPDTSFTPVWYSVYRFQCRRLERFVHGRIVFAGDSAHVVSPFGARGCNGGVADADNFGWKLSLVLTGAAEEALIESYDAEAVAAADENIRQSRRSTNFISPNGPWARWRRNAVLAIASRFASARKYVNSGRLATPVAYPASPLNTADTEGDRWEQGPSPGSPATDGRVDGDWLLERIGGDFAVLVSGVSLPIIRGVKAIALDQHSAPRLIGDYGLQKGGAYLIRPDHRVAARWRNPTASLIEAAIIKASGGLRPEAGSH